MPLSCVTDHRGVSVPIVGLLSDRPRELADETVPISVQEEIDREVRDSGVAGFPPIAFTALQLVVFLGAWGGIWFLTGVPLYKFPVIIISAAAAAIAAMVTLPLRRMFYTQAQAAPIVRAFLARSLCPACGYSLAGSEPADDGCTVCPECGTAWRLPVQHAPLP